MTANNKKQRQSRQRGIPRPLRRVIPFPRRMVRPFPQRQPRRIRPYRPKLRVIYGRDKDLAFGSKSKGMGQVIATPVSESRSIQTYFKFRNDKITFCQPIRSAMFSANVACLPLNPMCYYGRVGNIAQNFQEFAITRAVVHWVPLIGTTSTGMVAIAGTRACTPITCVTANQFNDLTQISAEMSPVWMCTKYVVPELDSTHKRMDPMNKLDIPNNVYVVGSGLAGNLSVSGSLFLELTIQLFLPSPTVYLTPYQNNITLTISAAGTRCSIASLTNIAGIVLSSTATNIDVGEYVTTPPYTLAATDYTTNIFHNGTETDYAVANDQGAVVLIAWAVN